MFNRGRGLSALLVVAAVVAAGCSDPEPGSGDLGSGDGSGETASSGAGLVTTVSSRPDMVTGGSTVIEVAAEYPSPAFAELRAAARPTGRSSA